MQITRIQCNSQTDRLIILMRISYFCLLSNACDTDMLYISPCMKGRCHLFLAAFDFELDNDSYDILMITRPLFFLLC